MTPSPWLLPAEDVVAETRKLALPTARPHWSTLAVLVGRIDAEKLHAPDFETTRAFCLHEFEMAPRDTEEYLALWRLLRDSYPRLSYEAWLQLSKARALEILRAVKLGGDVYAFYARALAARSAREFAEDLVQLLGAAEPWRRLDFAVPESLSQLVEAAMTLALAVVKPGVDPDALDQPGVRIACLEEIVRSYVTRDQREPDA